MNKPPAFQFYAADFLVDVMGMSDEEVGMLIKMLASQWIRGSLPGDPQAIRKLISSRKLPSIVVLEKFPVGDEGLRRNPRLENERAKQEAFRRSRVTNANKRWGKAADDATALHTDHFITDANAQQNGCTDDPLALAAEEFTGSACAAQNESTNDARASSLHDFSTSKTHTLQSSSSFSSSEKEKKSDRIATFAEVLTYAQSAPIGITKGCAEAFFDEMETLGWTHRGVAIADWRARFRRFATKWHQNEQGRKFK